MPTGIEHGTVTVVVLGRPFEVTTLREDVETFGRHAKVAFGRDWKRDAERRDFTMNALSVARDGTVYDYVGGLADVEARRVRFIGDAATRIAEDYLRILRFFRFHAAYGEGALDPAGVAACIAGRAGLEQLSRERVRMEIIKLLLAKHAVPVLAVMTEVWIARAGARRGAAARKSCQHDASWRRRLRSSRMRCAAWARSVVAVVEDAERLRERLRLANAEYERLASMADGWWHISRHWASRKARVLLYRLGPERFTDRVLLAWTRSPRGAADPAWRCWRRCPRAGAPRFSSQGRGLRRRGVAKGPRLGAAMRAAEEAWIAAGFPDEGAAMAAIADATVAELTAELIQASMMTGCRIASAAASSQRCSRGVGATRPLPCFALHCGHEA